LITSLLISVLGCGSEDESSPQASSSQQKPASPAAQVSEPDVDKLIADGIRLFVNTKYAASIEEFGKAIQLDDQNAIAYRIRARSHMYMGGYWSKIDRTSSHRNIRLDSEQAPSSQDHFQKALADLERATHLDSSDFKTQHMMGTCLRNLNETDRALAAFDEAIRLAPDDAAAHYHRGVFHFFKRRWVQADADFTRAIDLDSKLDCAFVGRATLKLGIGDIPGALADFDAAIQLDDM
jgi:tetratricopeptide (TPR) repeat protein